MGTVQGHTLDEERLPLAFAEIVAYDAQLAYLVSGTLSDEGGLYRLDLKAPKAYRIVLRYMGTVVDEQTVELGDGKTLMVDLNLPELVCGPPIWPLDHPPRLVDPTGRESTHTLAADAIRRWR